MAKLSFEKQMQRLQEIVDLLEDEDTDIEKGIALYEEGLKLADNLEKQLNGFEKKIAELNQKEENDDI